MSNLQYVMSILQYVMSILQYIISLQDTAGCHRTCVRKTASKCE